MATKSKYATKQKPLHKMKQPAADLHSDSESEDEGELTDAQLQALYASGQLKSMAKPRAPAKTAFIYNTNGIEAKIKEFAVTPSLPWPETLLVSSALPAVDHNDDFAREDAFYEQTLRCVKEGEKKLKSFSIPTIRPSDYYAEMVKTDDHMRKVRENMLNQEQSIEASEAAKRMREMRKFGKKIQQSVLEKRQKEKKAASDTSARMRKNLKNKMDDGGDDFNIAVDDTPEKKGVNARRQAKNAKYSFPRRDKRNSKESSADMSKFSIKGNKRPFAGAGGKGAGGKGGKIGRQGGKKPMKAKQRPGKANRMKQRQRGSR